ncbi:ras-related protein Rap-2c-like [Paramacrobiotus metropolitanus]|uniref:ras-related protein Rap-2c-like n=1 Tax=Paramacrobiotus metropolitanus TaxID=2943436 RepID=UPI002445D981|nr:ras-related protein Rap-2c-like [Paramacrobiotus metropolitanus]
MHLPFVMPLKPNNSLHAMVSPRPMRRTVEATKSDGGENNNKETYRVVMLGSNGVGKSALVENFVRQRSLRKSRHSSNEMHHIEFTEFGHAVTVELLDTSDYQNFPAMRELAIRQAHAFILVSSVDSEESFEHVKELRQEILRIKQSQSPANQPPILVVANKIDLPKHQWSFDTAYAELVVHCDWEDCGFVSCSVQEPNSVQKIFDQMIIQINASTLREPGSRPPAKNMTRRQSVPNLLDVPVESIKRTPSFPRKKKLSRSPNPATRLESHEPASPVRRVPSCNVQ